METEVKEPAFTYKKVEGIEGKGKRALEAELIAEKQAEDLEKQEPPAEPEPIVIELKDEDVLSHLSKKFNKDVKSYEDLIEVREIELPEDVQAFAKYKKDTGRGIEDFIKLNRDFDKAEDNSLIKEFYLSKEDGIDDSDVETMMEDFIPEVIDEDLDTEEEIKRKQSSNKKKELAKKKTLKEAKKYFESQKEQYKVPIAGSTASLSDEDKEVLANYQKYKESSPQEAELQARKAQVFSEKTEKLFSPDFKGFEVKLGEKTVTFSPGEPTELKTLQSTPMNFINKFMDKDGVIVDAVGYHKGLSMAINGDKWLQFAYEQGRAEAIEEDARVSKNINMGFRQNPQSISKTGIKVVKVDAGGSSSRLKFKKV